MIEVLSSERKDNKKGPWLILKGKDDKGQERTWNVFDSKMIECYKGPGKYDSASVKDGQYWKFTKLELMHSSKPESVAGPAPASHVGTQPRLFGRGDIAIACVAAAGQVYRGQGNGSETTVNDNLALCVRVLMAECSSFIAGKSETKTEGA